jgi:probable addiction module antidote protein
MARRKIALEPFEASQYLKSDLAIAEFLSEALRTGKPEVFAAALAVVAKARGMSQIAKEAGLNRAGLYEALSPDSDLSFETVHKIMNSLGVKLNAEVA